MHMIPYKTFFDAL